MSFRTAVFGVVAINSRDQEDGLGTSDFSISILDDEQRRLSQFSIDCVDPNCVNPGGHRDLLIRVSFIAIGI